MDSPPKNFLKGLTLGTLVGVLVQLGGYLLTSYNVAEFGWVIFCLVPFFSGFAVAAVVRRPYRIMACCLVSIIVTFTVLLFIGWEGIVCCIMSLPLVALGVAVGALFGYHVRGKFIDQLASPKKGKVLLILLCPFLIAAADQIERPFRSIQQQEVFTTEATFQGTPDQVWDLVAQMQKLDGPRPFLLRVGLPVPSSCELDRAEVGGRRVCYFNNGWIAQEVTEWQRPSFMGLRVSETTLPGRRWLTFIDASYELQPHGTQTRIVRHTTIGTRLYPRWYWRPLERWGVTSEHEFVFSNMQRWTQTTNRPQGENNVTPF